MSYAKSELRKATALIVMKDGKYLSRVGTMMLSSSVWDPHLSNAWRTRNKQEAQEIADRVGGILALFNSITWEVRVL